MEREIRGSEPGARSTSASEWSAYLSAALGRRVDVSFGRARRQVLVATEGDPALKLRMNAGFSEAPPEVRAAVAAWLRSDPRSTSGWETLEGWIEQLAEGLAAEPRRARRIESRGEAHDLARLAAELREEFLPDSLLAPERWPEIGWGPRGRRRVRHSLQLGSFVANEGLVRIHRVLDQPPVPDWFVRFVLFHELLHAALPSRESPRGRTIHHGREFRARERAFPDYERAVAWQERHLPRLIRSVRTGRPMGKRGHEAPRPLLPAARRIWRSVQGLLFE